MSEIWKNKNKKERKEQRWTQDFKLAEAEYKEKKI